jgi:hypothetical protein
VKVAVDAVNRRGKRSKPQGKPADDDANAATPPAGNAAEE